MQIAPYRAQPNRRPSIPLTAYTVSPAHHFFVLLGDWLLLCVLLSATFYLLVGQQQRGENKTNVLSFSRDCTPYCSIYSALPLLTHLSGCPSVAARLPKRSPTIHRLSHSLFSATGLLVPNCSTSPLTPSLLRLLIFSPGGTSSRYLPYLYLFRLGCLSLSLLLPLSSAPLCSLPLSCLDVNPQVGSL
ncbi:hypothetical protein EDB81DRAFT_786547 [Dactylonectria macrodidyma]|uniref:Uncharacterized protein n=1 Tax=Dactylonectria macrodidyma TaxID=307937 RepID=A0A9P9J8F7_9HYPO|nr:hypothetical protein EDB81DRAFT_786547 [Dactylonectria macrodidyma]